MRGARFLLGLWLASFMLLAACTDQLRTVQGTTVRLEDPVVPDGTELELRILTKASQCDLPEADPHNCLPWVDRASGEVHLAFRLYAGSDPWAMALDKGSIQISHLGALIEEGKNKQSYDLIPHAPEKTDQLFVLLIDGSGSMNEPAHDRPIDRVREALLLPEVIKAFFPSDQNTGVVLLEFAGDQVRPVGGAMKVITRRADYRQLVKGSLRASGGYTHLYSAIRYATGELLSDEPEVVSFMRSTTSAPTIVALTDGFNNERHDDTCATNAKRLGRLVNHLRDVRGPESDPMARPRVYTVGLGRPFLRRFELPEDLTSVRPVALCGKKYKDWRIDGKLETLGIDNASLAWIADVGGGSSFVKRKTSGLGEAFRAAAATQYRWFEVRYRLDPFHLRRSFKATIRLTAFAQAEASVVIHPSAWLDAPPGRRAEDGWTRPASIMRTASLVMPLLSLLVILGFLPPALFNTRRILSGRLRQPAAPAPPRAAPPAQPPPEPAAGADGPSAG